MIGNINALCIALDNDISCKIIDSNNQIQLINKKFTIEKSNKFGKYISLMPLTSKVEGVTLKGFKYSLDNDSLEIGKTIGVSNELIQDVGTIEISKGILIFIESKD